MKKIIPTKPVQFDEMDEERTQMLKQKRLNAILQDILYNILFCLIVLIMCYG